jgi:rod shape-determining protein MreB
MVVDIGGGRAEAAVISMYGIVVSESVRVAGDKIDDAIIAYIKRRRNLVIGERTAEEVKREVGSALPLEKELSTQVQGRDQVTGLPKTITVTSTEIGQAIADPLNTIVSMVKAVLERTPPELAADVLDQGVVLTGGGSLLRNLDQLLTQETGVNCHVAEEPMTCVALGAGLALEHLDLIKRNLPTEEELVIAGS